MGTHPWANYLDQHIIDTEHYRRLRGRPALGRAAEQHLEPARPRRGPGGRPGRRGLATGCASCCRRCWRSRRTRRSSTTATPACTPSARRSSPGPSRAAASTSRSATGRAYADFVQLLERHGLDRRGDPALVERPAPPLVRHGRGADLRRPDARRRVAQPGRPDRRLRRPVRAGLRRGQAAPRAPAPARDRGEPLARDPLRDGRRDDRLPRAAGGPDAGRARGDRRVDRAGAAGARARGGAAGAQRRAARLRSRSPRARRSRRSTGAPSRRPARPTRRREPSVADEATAAEQRGRRRAARASRARRRSAHSSRRRSARSGSRT